MAAKPNGHGALPALTLDERAMPPRGTPALVAVSGGRDSVALLHALVQRGEKPLVVCHLDHGLREESRAEAEFVAELALGYNMPSQIERRRSTTQPRQSVETAAREARYDFFGRIAARDFITHLYLAHHADDQAETLLFNLLRGSGAAGLGGMRPVSQRGALTLHRPLLGTWREEIDRYVAAHGLKYCEDPSNRDLQHTRNRLRHEIIPSLESALGRNVRPALWRAAEILAEEDAYLRTLLPEITAADLEVNSLRALPLAFQRRAFRAWLQASGVPDVSFHAVEQLVGLLHTRSPAKINLARGLHARRRAGRIFLEVSPEPLTQTATPSPDPAAPQNTPGKTPRARR